MCVGRDIITRQWPRSARVTVNGVHVFAQPMEIASQTGNGACVDITAYLKPSGEANIVHMSVSVPPAERALRLQALLVRVVAPLSVETLARRIGASQTQAAEDAKARMRRVLFAPPPGAGRSGAGEEEDGLEEMVATCTGELYFMYRYISRESCSQFDSLPLTSLTIQSSRCAVR
jgi:hypothetical protein